MYASFRPEKHSNSATVDQIASNEFQIPPIHGPKRNLSTCARRVVWGLTWMNLGGTYGVQQNDMQQTWEWHCDTLLLSILLAINGVYQGIDRVQLGGINDL